MIETVEETYYKADVEVLSKITLLQFIEIAKINNNKVKTIENSKKDYEMLKRLCTEVLKIKPNGNGYVSRHIKYTQVNGGRFFINDVGLQNMPRNIRAILSHRHLYDLDMANAQPSILLKVCEDNDIDSEQLKDYCKNREEYLELIMEKIKCARNVAKDLIISMLYDENYDKQSVVKIKKIKKIKKLDENFKSIQKSIFDKFSKEHLDIQKGMDFKENKNGSFLARYLQMLENKYLFKAIDVIVNHTDVQVFLFDGVEVSKMPHLGSDEINIETVLKNLNKEFKKDGIKWTCKEFDNDVIEYFNNTICKEIVDVVDSYFGKDIIDISRHILEGKLKDRIFWSDGILYYINNYKIVNNEKIIESELYDFISEQKYIRYEEKTNAKGQQVEQRINCSCVPREIESIVKAVINKAPRVRNFINDVWNFTQFKIFFNNGYYDFKDKKFVNGKFSKTFIKINRDYTPTRNKDAYNKIYDKIFNPIFTITNDDNTRKQLLNNFLYNISHFIAGDIEKKLWLQLEGFRNCGKGAITDLLEKAFEDYVSSTNAGNFFSKKGIIDEEKALAWLYDFQFKRICYTSEISLSQDVDGNIIKKFTSGGDSIKARKNYIDESKIKLQCGLLICCNDMPDIKPTDACDFRRHYRMRSKFIRKSDIEYSNFKDDKNDSETFVGEFKTTCYKADENFKSSLLNNEDLLMEFINIIIDSYDNYISYPEQMVEVNEDEDNDYTKVHENFIIIDDDDAFTTNESIKQECKSLKLPFTDKKVKDLLKLKGAQAGVKTIDGKTYRGLKYVKLQSVIDDENYEKKRKEEQDKQNEANKKRII